MTASRRDFLRTAGLAAAWAAFDPILPRASAATRRLNAVAATAPPPFELEEATLAQLQDWMASGRYTSQKLCQLYLARIEALDRKGPTLRSVIETNPDALTIAAQLDAERKAGKVRGPLHGIPLLIKDNIATADRMETTAGSLALVGAKPARDAFVAQRLREAGAVILGKTNLSEWANWRSTHSTSGWSGRGGLCRSPYALDRNPCGSSSGSGAAAAASFCAVAVGTETDGSIVCPSGANGLVGIKPTVGLVSRAGIIPISHSQDTAGPMCRTVTDAAILLGALQGADARDPATAAAPGGVPADYAQFLDPNGLKGARIGVARAHFFGFSPAVDAVLEAAIAVLKAQGAEIVDPADLPHAGEYDDAEFTVLQYEFKQDIDAYLADLGPGSPMKTLADLIAFNQQHAKEEMPYFGQEIFVQSQAKGPLTDDAYLEAAAHCRRLSRAEGLDALFADKKLDAIVMPTNGPAWTTDLVNGDHFTGGSSTPAAVAGYPSITVPAGFVYGLPVGISFTGKAWSEPTLIRLAFAYEQASKARKPPQFLSTV
ncbi:MAG TPA: amidase, partial [Streptosporangiaceae bacterium]|nr:amidase [Streptosporangiaceae bacterium]